MRLLGRRARVPEEVLERAGVARAGEVLAAATTTDGTWLVGTRTALVLVPSSSVGPAAATRSIRWEEVEDASWDRDETRMRVTEVGEYGEVRPSYTFEMEEPVRLLQLVRERVTASIVLQRRVGVRGRLGVTVIGRRSPDGGEVRWMHAYDPGLDPADPEVSRVAVEALAEARSEVGEGR